MRELSVKTASIAVHTLAPTDAASKSSVPRTDAHKASLPQFRGEKTRVNR